MCKNERIFSFSAVSTGANTLVAFLQRLRDLWYLAKEFRTPRFINPLIKASLCAISFVQKLALISPPAICNSAKGHEQLPFHCTIF